MAKNARKSGGGGHRITAEELRKRVAQCEICLSQGWLIPEVTANMAKVWRVSEKSVMRYLSKAQQNLDIAVAETRQEHRARSLHFYRQVLKNPKATISQKISSQKQIDRLLGLPQPILVAQTTPEGKSLLEAARELTEEQAIALASLRHAVG